jgi:hypothetical protein
MPSGYQYSVDQFNENAVSVVELDDGAIEISVAQEKAIDSYNDTFECRIELPLEEARKLREWLNAVVT